MPATSNTEIATPAAIVNLAMLSTRSLDVATACALICIAFKPLDCFILRQLKTVGSYKAF